MAEGKLELNVSDDDPAVGYISLPEHPGSAAGVVRESVRIDRLLSDYRGPDIVFDFDSRGVLIGIEIVG